MIARQVRVETVVEIGVEREIVAEHGGVDIGEFRGALLVLPVSDASQPDDEREQRPRQCEARKAATFTRRARSGGAERARRQPCPVERAAYLQRELVFLLIESVAHSVIPFAFSACANACVAREQCVFTLPSEQPIAAAVSATS